MRNRIFILSAIVASLISIQSFASEPISIDSYSIDAVQVLLMADQIDLVPIAIESDEQSFSEFDITSPLLAPAAFEVAVSGLFAFDVAQPFLRGYDGQGYILIPYMLADRVGKVPIRSVWNL